MKVIKLLPGDSADITTPDGPLKVVSVQQAPYLQEQPNYTELGAMFIAGLVVCWLAYLMLK